MGKLKYEVILYWSKEDKAFIAEVPELPGCAADGQNYNEALENVGKLCRNGLKRPNNQGGAYQSSKAGWFLRKKTAYCVLKRGY